MWQEELADLLDALLDCNDENEAHDLIVNYTEEFKDGIARLRDLADVARPGPKEGSL